MNQVKGSLSRVLWMLSAGIANAQPGAGAAVRLFEIGPPGFLQPLDLPGRVGNGNFRKLRIDGAPAAFEYAEHIARRDHVPGRQRIHFGDDAARHLIFRQLAPRPRTGRGDLGRFALARIGLAQQVVLERQDFRYCSSPRPTASRRSP